MITANRSFDGWDDVFPDKAMRIAATDRLVHHATLFEMNVESRRRRVAHAAATVPGDIENAPDSPGDIDAKPRNILIGLNRYSLPKK